MNALERAERRQLVFTASEESWRRIDQVMALQGHDKYSLAVARGFALVQWVEEQLAAGRTVGAKESGSDDFEVLVERPELLGPRPRMQVVQDQPAPAPAAEREQVQVEAPPVAPPGSPMAALRRLESSAAGKKAAEPSGDSKKNAPLDKPKKFVVPKRQVKVDTRPSGTGMSPIRTLEVETAECLARGEASPIEHSGMPLPADLDRSCLQYLVDGSNVREASHFRLAGPSVVAIYGHFPKKDWCVYDPITRKWSPDVQAREGFARLYSIQAAIDYLQGLPAADTNPEDLEEVTY